MRAKDFPQFHSHILVEPVRHSYSWLIGAHRQEHWHMLMEETGRSGPLAFFARRWQRQVPLGTLFWRDMIVVGTLINVAATFAGLITLGLKAELAIAMLVFFSPLPYNVFLVGAVWRTAELVSAEQAWTVRLGAAAWLVIASLL